MRLAPFLLVLSVIPLFRSELRAQIPPFPEAMKNIKPVLRMAPYQPPPKEFSKEGYAAWRKQALFYLEHWSFDANCPKICLDLILAAIAVGNQADQDEALKTLLLKYSSSEEAVYILTSQNISKTRKMFNAILNSEERSLDNSKIRSLQAFSNRINAMHMGDQEVLEFHEFEYIANYLFGAIARKAETAKAKENGEKEKEKYKEEFKGLSAFPGFDVSKKKDGPSGGRTAIGSQEAYFLDYLITGDVGAIPKTPHEIYAAYTPQEQPVDILISLYIWSKTKAGRLLLLCIYDQILSASEREKYVARLIKASLLVELDRLEEARPIIAGLALEKREPVARSLRAWCHLKEGKKKEAVDELRGIAKEFPSEQVREYCKIFSDSIEQGFDVLAAQELRSSILNLRGRSIDTMTVVTVNHRNFNKTTLFLNLKDNWQALILEEAGATRSLWSGESHSFVSNSRSGMTCESKRILPPWKAGVVRRDGISGKYYFFCECTPSGNKSLRECFDETLNQPLLLSGEDFSDFVQYAKEKRAFLKKSAVKNEYELFHPDIKRMNLNPVKIKLSNDGVISEVDVAGSVNVKFKINEYFDREKIREKTTVYPTQMFFDHEKKPIFDSLINAWWK